MLWHASIPTLHSRHTDVMAMMRNQRVHGRPSPIANHKRGICQLSPAIPSWAYLILMNDPPIETFHVARYSLPKHSLYICMNIHMHMYIYIYLSLSTHLSIYRSIYLSIYLSIYPSIYLSIYRFIYAYKYMY